MKVRHFSCLFLVAAIVMTFFLCPDTTLANRSGLPWNSGVSPGSTNGPASIANVTAFGNWRKRPVDVGITFIGQNGWSVAKGGSYAKMANIETIEPGGAVKAFLDNGIIPVMTVPMVISSDAGKFAMVAGGGIDAEHRAIATQIYSITNGRLIYLRLGHEADEGYPWSYTGHDGAGQPDPANPADYKAAWRRIASIYRTTVPGAKLVWNVLKNTRQAVADYYPGDDVVDVISIDPYDNGSGGFCDSLAIWERTCLGSYNPTTGVSKGIGGILAFAKLHSKKIAVDEWGASNGRICPPGGTTVIDSKTVCALDPLNGANNSYYAAAMFDFFAANSGWIEYESYFNRAGRDDGFGGEHQVFPKVAHNANVSDAYYTKYAGEAPPGTTGTTGTIGTTGTTVTGSTVTGGVVTGTTLVYTGGCSERYISGKNVPNGYGAAYNVFSGYKELLLRTVCDAQNNVTLAANTPDTATTKYVYKHGYRWTGSGWAAITFTGTPAPGDAGGNWLLMGGNSVIKSDDMPQSGYVYFAAYTCTFYANAWKCGCRDSFCGASLWQLQAIYRSIGLGSITTGAGTTGGTTVGGTTGTVTGDPNQVASPNISPFGGYFDPTRSVTITDSTVGSTIHYTLDGTTPTETSPTYTAAFTLSATTTVKAGAWKAGMTPSAIVTAQFYKGHSSSGDSGFVGKSGMPWNAGQWINGSDDRAKRYTDWMGHDSDTVTQAMPEGEDIWAETGGADTDAQVDADFNRTPAQWATNPPVLAGVFSNGGWRSHIWGGGYPANVHRQRLIHLAWAEPIPREAGNNWTGSTYRNPELYKHMKEGDYDKYIFLLGRKFAYLDKQYGDPAFPMTIDFFYEFTLETHGKSPEGSYTDATGKHFTYQDFQYAFARWIRVFKEGYKYQRGSECPYNVSWRPQLNFINSDRRGGGSTIRHEALWPNNVAGWTPGAHIINGITVFPDGPVGRTVDFVGASWHDSSFQKVKGASATDPGNNWAALLAGNAQFWGFNEIAAFARAQGVKMVFPEWAPRRETAGISPYPADMIRFTYAFFNANKDILDHENLFEQGDGDMYAPWPTIPSGQNPVPVYHELWNGH